MNILSHFYKTETGWLLLIICIHFSASPVASHEISILPSHIDLEKQAVKAPVSSCKLGEAQVLSIVSLIPKQRTPNPFQLGISPVNTSVSEIKSSQRRLEM